MILINDLVSDEIITYGGEYKDSGCGIYGIQFLEDELSLELSPQQAVTLYKKLKEHLEINGHKL